jgi:hypothetical protein
MLAPATVGPKLTNIGNHPNEVVPKLADKPQVTPADGVPTDRLDRPTTQARPVGWPTGRSYFE